MDQPTGGTGDSHEQTQGSADTAKAKAQEAMHGLEAYLAPIFEKFPHLPEGGRKVIVDIAPWIVLVFGILGVVALLGAGGLGALATMFAPGFSMMFLVQIVFGIASAALLLMAFPGMKAHTKKGWNLVFYSQVVSIIGGVIGLVIGGMYGNNIIGIVISVLIGFYILFEVRTYYK